eukprot:TRINITY_DN80906_c0_g1_i1.p1 TRINITY_DN80906_c0_g1~~TRINITY_DN80906_c0_g1_i1.p1  ORF type:complete len:878 (-),score=106.14 TRINITY_DN80906_c0_g1_i1:116-2749(-)
MNSKRCFRTLSEEEDEPAAHPASSSSGVKPDVIGEPRCSPEPSPRTSWPGDLDIELHNLDASASSGFAFHDRRSNAVKLWRRKMVKSLKRPWNRKQQQPSWDSARTVEMLGEELDHYEEQRALSFVGRWLWTLQDWMLASCVGVMCFLVYVVIETGVGGLSSLRFGYCSGHFFKPEERCPEQQWVHWQDGVGGFLASVVFGTVFATGSAWLVVNFAPTASGSGIPEIKTILNGFVLDDVVTFRTLFIKVAGLILSVASGMSLGHEGPMVHVGVCCAHIASRWVAQFRNEGKRRELMSAGVAAGISSAFGTPVGGVLFSLEETSSQFSSRTLLLSFVASVSATLCLSVANLQGDGHLTKFSVSYTVSLHPSEYVVFACLGITGGLLGAVFNMLNIRWNAFRMSAAYKKRVSPIKEVAFVAFLTLVSSWPLALTRPLNAETIHALFENCSRDPGKTTTSRLQVEIGLCSASGEYIALRPDLVSSMWVAAFVRFLQMTFTIGTACPAGLFVPSLFIGACLGRGVAGCLKAMNAGHRLFPYTVDPGVYSMIGSAAVLAGVSRITISLVVIMLELTNGPAYVVPFMLSVLIAKAVGDSLNEGIYDLQIILKGYPFLHEEVDITFTERCCDIMESRITKLDVSLHPQMGDLRALLAATSYRGYPVVDGPRFVGYIRRKQLEKILAALSTIRSETDEVTLDDFGAGVDTTVMRMVPDAPLTRVHQVFKQLGCMHIFVVASHGPGTKDELQGIISKKMYLGFLKSGTVGHMHGHSSSQELDAHSGAESEAGGNCEMQRLSTNRGPPAHRTSLSVAQNSGDDATRKSPKSPTFNGRTLSVLTAALAASVQADGVADGTPRLEDGTCSDSGQDADVHIEVKPKTSGG